jgi:hypothetical protein
MNEGRRQHHHTSSRRRVLLPQVPPADLRSSARAWGWLVRQQNLDVLGEAADLNEFLLFLFGSERVALKSTQTVCAWPSR